MALIVKEGTNGYDGTDDATEQLITAALEKKGLTIRTAAQDKTFLENNSQKLIDDAFQKRNQQLEDTIKRVSGVDKLNASEKYYDYFERAMGTMNTKLTEATTKLADIEKQGAGGANAGLIDEYKRQITTLQGQVKSMNEEHEKAVADLNGKVFKSKFDSLRDNAISKIKETLRGDLAPELIPDIIAARTAQFEANFVPKDVQGVTIFHDKQGNPVLDKKEGTPKSIDAIMTEIFGPYIDPKRQQGGAGSGGPKPAGGAGGGTPPAKWKEAQRPETILNKVQLGKWLNNDLKLEPGSADFDQAFAQFSVKADGSQLPTR